jgi:hypothetical protein
MVTVAQELPNQAGRRMITPEYFWSAICLECEWTQPTVTMRQADLRAELHTLSTGHQTDLDQFD